MSETQLDRACQSNLGVLGKVRPQDLDAPTPCTSWDVRALVNHFIGTARFWAAMMTGADLPGEEDYATGDLVAAYKASIGVATAAFEADGAMEKMVLLPFGEFPGTVVLSMAALDQFTHGWDLARALGLPTDLDPALAGELLNQARQTIPDAFRGPDGQAPFGPAFEAPAGAGPAAPTAARRRRPGHRLHPEVAGTGRSHRHGRSSRPQPRGAGRPALVIRLDEERRAPRGITPSPSRMESRSCRAPCPHTVQV